MRTGNDQPGIECRHGEARERAAGDNADAAAGGGGDGVRGALVGRLHEPEFGGAAADEHSDAEGESARQQDDDQGDDEHEASGAKARGLAARRERGKRGAFRK